VPVSIQQVAGPRRGQRRQLVFARRFRAEADGAADGAVALLAGVAWQADTDALVNLDHETGAIAGIQRMAPAIGLAEELERLPDDVRAGVRQVTDAHVGPRRDPGRREGEFVALGDRQADPERAVRVRVRRARQRQAKAHVENAVRCVLVRRLECRVDLGARDHEVGLGFAVRPDRGSRPERERRATRPGGIVVGLHEAPGAIGAFVQHRHRVAGKQAVFLEAVEVDRPGRAKHHVAVGPRPHVGALEHQPEAHGHRFRDRFERETRPVARIIVG
jgi:hypothetical protein